MPYDIRQVGDQWETYNTETDEVKGKHDTKEKAENHRAALYANVPDAKKSILTRRVIEEFGGALFVGTEEVAKK